MSILLQVTEESNRQGRNTPPINKLYGIPSISLVRDNGTSATIILDGKRNNEERIVSEPYDSIKALTNSGYTDFILPLNQTNGKEILLRASNIVEIYDNPEGKGVVRFRDEDKSEDITYTVDENIESIIGLTPSSEWKRATSSPFFEVAIGGAIITPAVCTSRYRNIGGNTVVVDWQSTVELGAGVTTYFYGPTATPDLPFLPGPAFEVFRSTGVIDGSGESKQFVNMEVSPFAWTFGANDLNALAGGVYVIAGQITYQTK